MNVLRKNIIEKLAEMLNAATLAQKEPWEMTSEEYAQDCKKRQDAMGGEWGKISYHHGILDEHKHTPLLKYMFLKQDADTAYSLAGEAHFYLIKDALAEGKPVPANVLAEYPDLQPKPAAEAAKNKEVWNMTFDEFRAVAQMKYGIEPNGKAAIYVKMPDENWNRAKVSFTTNKTEALENYYLDAIRYASYEGKKNPENFRYYLKRMKEMTAGNTGLSDLPPGLRGEILAALGYLYSVKFPKSQVDAVLNQKQSKKEFKDIGERVGGARKHYSAQKFLLNGGELAQVEAESKTAAEAAVKKVKILAPPTPEADREAGIASSVAYFKWMLYKEIPNQPHISTPLTRSMYVTGLQWLFGKLNELRTLEELTAFLDTTVFAKDYIAAKSYELWKEANANVIREGIREFGSPELYWTWQYLQQEWQADKFLKKLVNWWKNWNYAGVSSTAATAILRPMYYMTYERGNGAEVNSMSHFNDGRNTTEYTLKSNVAEYKFSADKPITLEAVHDLKLSKKTFDEMLENQIDWTFGSTLFKNIERAESSYYYTTNIIRKILDDAKKYDGAEALKKYEEKYEQFHINLYALQQNFNDLKGQEELKIKLYKEKYIDGIKEKHKLKEYLENKEAFNQEAQKEAEIVTRREQDNLQKYIDNTNKNIIEFEATRPDGNDIWTWIPSQTSEDGGKTRKTQKEKVELHTPLAYIKRVGGVALPEGALETRAGIQRLLMDKLGFKSLQTGNSLPDREAREHLKHFIGAVSDLAEMLNWDIKTINQAGQLSLALATRGIKGSAAHYESTNKIINLTRKFGDGSVAHEWAHFLDNMISRFYSSQGRYLSDKVAENLQHSYLMDEPKDKPVVFAMNTIFQYILHAKKRLPPNPYGGRINYSNDPPPVIEYTVEYDKEVYEKRNHFDYNDKVYPKGGNFEGNMAFVRSVWTSLFTVDDKFFTKKGSSGLDITRFLMSKYEVAETTLQLKCSTSLFYYYTKEYGEKVNKKKYYTEPHELFARAFEIYVVEKLTRAGRYNNYLVASRKHDEERSVYPFGEDRQVLFTLFDELMQAIKTAMEIPDFTPWATGRVTEEIEVQEVTQAEEETEDDEEESPVEATSPFVKGADEETNEEIDTIPETEENEL